MRLSGHVRVSAADRKLYPTLQARQSDLVRSALNWQSSLQTKPQDDVARYREEQEMVVGVAVETLVGGVRHQSVTVSQALKEFSQGGRGSDDDVIVHDVKQREQQSQDLRRGDMK